MQITGTLVSTYNLHNLVKMNEILGAMLMTSHNLYYFQNLTDRIRNYTELGKDFDFVS